MPYTSDKPALPEDLDELRARIPGWGADLDPADRPSYPREVLDPTATGAHWTLPEQQPGGEARERSIEHARVTPAFGTAQPLSGLSGAVRRYAYARHSEAKAAHWLLLIAADRVDVTEHVVRSFATRRPDNPITQSGIRAEATHGGVHSRRGRSDVRHQVLDPVVNGVPWALGTYVAWRAVRALRRR
jgi:hypothetical protein